MAFLGSARVPVVLHCFEGGERGLQEAKERGYCVGLAGSITYKNSGTADVILLMDPERLWSRQTRPT